MLICVIPSLSRVTLAGSPTMTILLKKSGILRKGSMSLAYPASSGRRAATWM